MYLLRKAIIFDRFIHYLLCIVVCYINSYAVNLTYTPFYVKNLLLTDVNNMPRIKTKEAIIRIDFCAFPSFWTY